MAIMRLIAKIRIKRKCSQGDVRDCADTGRVSIHDKWGSALGARGKVPSWWCCQRIHIWALCVLYRTTHLLLMMRWCRHTGTRIKHRRLFWQLTCVDIWNQASSSLKKRDPAAKEYPQYRRHLRFLSRTVSSCTNVNKCVVVQNYFRRSFYWWIWDISSCSWIRAA